MTRQRADQVLVAAAVGLRRTRGAVSLRQDVMFASDLGRKQRLCFKPRYHRFFSIPQGLSKKRFSFEKVFDSSSHPHREAKAAFGAEPVGVDAKGDDNLHRRDVMSHNQSKERNVKEEDSAEGKLFACVFKVQIKNFIRIVFQCRMNLTLAGSAW